MCQKKQDYCKQYYYGASLCELYETFSRIMTTSTTSIQLSLIASMCRGIIPEREWCTFPTELYINQCLKGIYVLNFRLLNCIANLIHSPEAGELYSFLEACRIRPPMPGHTLKVTYNAGASVFSCQCPDAKLPSIPENVSPTAFIHHNTFMPT